MATAYKILGQTAANAAYATLYTTPVGKSAVVSSIVVCNVSGAAKQFRIGIMASAGTPASPTEFLAYDAAVPANDSIVMTLGITMEASKYIRVYGSDGNIGFTAFGSEIT
jgi:hypothetical protein